MVLYTSLTTLKVHICQIFRGIALLLCIDFSFPVPGRQQRVSGHPEMMLLSLIVIAVKLLYPFDDKERLAESLKDPTILTFDWALWLEAREQQNSLLNGLEHLPRGSEINVTETDVMQMSGEQLDDYLDWYERTWVDDERAEQKPRGLAKPLLEMFPAGRQDGSTPRPYDYRHETEKRQQSRDQRMIQVMREVKVRNVVSDGQEERESTRGIGSFYKRYRHIDELTLHAKAFHEATALLVGIKLETLLIAVLQTERKLTVWREEQLKAERGGGLKDDIALRTQGGHSGAKRKPRKRDHAEEQDSSSGGDDVERSQGNEIHTDGGDDNDSDF